MAKPYLATPRSDRKPELIAPDRKFDPAIQCRQLVRVLQWYLATAWVSGVIALAIQNEPHLARSGDRNNIEELKQRIAENSIPKEGQMGHDDRFGHGILNAPGLIGGESSAVKVGVHIVVEGMVMVRSSPQGGPR